MAKAFYYLTIADVPSQKANSVQIVQMCNAFARYTDELVLICRKGCMNTKNIFNYYGVNQTFRIHTISLPNLRILDKLWFAFAVLLHLRKNEKKAIIYSREPFVTGILCFLKFMSYQLILEVHAPPKNRFWKWWFNSLLYSGQLSYIVSISAALASKYRELFPDFPSERLLIAHDGASSMAIDDQHGFTVPTLYSKERCKVGYVGSLRPGKGMELMHELAALMPEHEFHIVGGNDDAIRPWKNRTKQSNLIFHGFVPPSKTEELIRSFDILLAPYQPVVLVGNDDVDISQWMSPLKLFEYMKCGKPIIASNLPVLREVLKHGHNALLVEATDPGQWCRHINRLLSDDVLRISISTNAFHDFCAKYTWDKRAQFIIENICFCTDCADKASTMTQDN